MTPTIAIDPGPVLSAYVVLRDGRPDDFGIVDNYDLVGLVRNGGMTGERLVIEMIASYGMPVGKEVFETCVWIGRFMEAWGGGDRLTRHDVKLHLCRSARANDASIRQALIDRFGPGKDAAIGTKKLPGPLYGVTKDVWQALALGVTYLDKLPAATEAA